jgi:hypothetical protein
MVVVVVVVVVGVFWRRGCRAICSVWVVGRRLLMTVVGVVG